MPADLHCNGFRNAQATHPTYARAPQIMHLEPVVVASNVQFSETRSDTQSIPSLSWLGNPAPILAAIPQSPVKS